MKRSRVSAFAAAFAAVLLAAGCTPGSGPAAPAATAPEPSGTVEFWHHFTDREAEAIRRIVTDFKAKYPKVTVHDQSGQDDDKMLQAIGAGNGPDIGMSYSTDIVGKFCSSGAWVDLKPYIDRDKVDLSQAPATPCARTPSSAASAARCRSSPTRTGSTTTRSMLAEAGIDGPPKTLDRADRRRPRS